MRQITAGILCFLCLVAPSTTPAEDGDLEREIASLRRSVDEIARLLDRALSHQRIDLLLKRLDLAQRGVVPLESELRGAQDRVESLRREIERLETVRERTEDMVSDDVRAGTDRPDSDNRRMLSEVEEVLDVHRAELLGAEARVRRLEDDLAERRERIEILEDAVDERWGGLP